MTTPDPLADARESLRARINTAIAPWRGSSEEPPFNATKLVIMALISGHEPLTRKEVCTWIAQTFVYYQDIAANVLWDCTGGRCARARKASTVSSQFLADGQPALTGVWGQAVATFQQMIDGVYLNYELPLLESDVGLAAACDVRYSIAPLMGEAWLDLESTAVDDTTFPFFELPAELRIVIYEMVFQYPKTGLYLPGKDGIPRALSKKLDATGEWPIDAIDIPGDTLHTRRLSSILSPLLTSRQFRREAMSIFFDINTFHFHMQYSIAHSLTKMPEVYRKEIMSISFGFTSIGILGEGTERAFRALKQLPRLRVLKIYLDHWMWKNSHDRGIVLSWNSMATIDVLRTIRGLEKVECPGCPELQALLQDMCKPKSLADGAAA
ncbi:hypothetical protein LTR17_000805 [Elasticomyces elasticus]|nr:hypothetical protein LTR17_000805 [Elasticomyces elasticus]